MSSSHSVIICTAELTTHLFTNTFSKATLEERYEIMNIPDYKKIDYRGFIFAVHRNYGLLLLHCTRKAKKGPHYQLPGGHIDNFEFEEAGRHV